MTAAWIVFWAAVFGIAMVLGGYPILLFTLDSLRRRPVRVEPDPPADPSITILIAVRNAASIIDAKLANALAAGRAYGPCEVVVVSDGSDDGTDDVIRDVIRAQTDERLRFVRVDGHQGKAQALNEGIRLCQSDLVVFTDADALMEPDALSRLALRFRDSGIGGVCGRRVLQEERTGLTEAQDRYVHFDSLIKEAESRRGSITSNDGKLYAVRRTLLRPIAEAVTDDLWVALNVIDQGFRFVYEPTARAFVKTPSRTPAHELARRRRIVSRSLRGIIRMRGLLDPLRRGTFAWGLLVNKVGRRSLPFFLGLLLVSSSLLAFDSWFAAVALGLQLAFYGLALLYAANGKHRGPGFLRRLTSICFYFVVGNVGTALGVVDFLLDRRVIRWDPMKTG